MGLFLKLDYWQREPYICAGLAHYNQDVRARIAATVIEIVDQALNNSTFNLIRPFTQSVGLPGSRLRNELERQNVRGLYNC